MYFKILVMIASIFALLQPVAASAHSNGQPYLLINGDYVVTNPFGGISSVEDMATEVFLVGQPIQFSINANVLSTPGQVYGWRWNKTDTDVQTGATVTHAYDKPGSYVVSLESKVPADTQYRQVATVGVTVVPKKDYVLPTVKVNVVQTGGGTVRFEAKINHDATAGTSRVEWNFADDSKGTGETVTHHYKDRKDFRKFPSIAVTDSNGITTYALFQLERRDGRLTASDVPGLPNTIQSSIAMVSSRSQQYWHLLALVPVLAVAIFVGMWWFRRRKAS